MYFVLDTDECLDDNGGCNQICNNTDGSYQCLCRKGFFLTSDNRTCQGSPIINIIIRNFLTPGEMPRPLALTGITLITVHTETL